jgi:hypothetical protein
MSCMCCFVWLCKLQQVCDTSSIKVLDQLCFAGVAETGLRRCRNYEISICYSWLQSTLKAMQPYELKYGLRWMQLMAIGECAHDYLRLYSRAGVLQLLHIGQCYDYHRLCSTTGVLQLHSLMRWSRGSNIAQLLLPLVSGLASGHDLVD